jgi:hypothetical protein
MLNEHSVNVEIDTNLNQTSMSRRNEEKDRMDTLEHKETGAIFADKNSFEN